MPEANTMETAKTELVQSFIKYITGVYLLQQEFIDDMQGGLQSVLEKYNVSSVNEQMNNVQDNTEAVAVAPKKTRKKSTKKEVVEEAAGAVGGVAEATGTAGTVEVVEAVEEAVEAVEEAVEEAVGALEEAVEAVEEAVEELTIPSHVSTALNNENAPSEKKTRQPRAKKGEAGEEPKKKRATNAFRVFLAEYSKNPELKKLKVSERTQLASPIWEKIKEDPEQLNVYEQKAADINRENGL